MRRKIIALCAALVVLCWCGVALGATSQEIFERTQFLNQQIDEMTDNSVYSNVYVDSLWIDLNNISTTGSVISYTYRNSNQTPTINTFTTQPRSFDSALDKIVRYVLGNIANTYRQEPFNTETTMITYQKTTVPIYVYGPYKGQELDEITLGLPNCFDIVYDTSHGRSDPVTPINMPVAEQILNATFLINSTTYSITNDGEITTKTMDVAPEIKDNRTFVPIRYLAYVLGVPRDGITWDGKTHTIGIAKGETTIELTLGSTIEIVNGEPIEMDVAPYVTKGRTLLPARWVAEPLGAKVDWDAESQQVKIEYVKEQGQ